MSWCACVTCFLSERTNGLQGEALPDVAGPTARLVRSADGSVVKAQPVPAFNNTELPGVQC